LTMDQLKMIHLVAIAPRPPHRYLYGAGLQHSIQRHGPVINAPVHLGDIVGSCSHDIRAKNRKGNCPLSAARDFLARSGAGEVLLDIIHGPNFLPVALDGAARWAYRIAAVQLGSEVPLGMFAVPSIRGSARGSRG